MFFVLVVMMVVMLLEIKFLSFHKMMLLDDVLFHSMMS